MFYFQTSSSNVYYTSIYYNILFYTYISLKQVAGERAGHMPAWQAQRLEDLEPNV